MANNAPGIQATINTRPLGQPAPAQGSDAFFCVGYAIWGAADTPTLVGSWNEYVQKFGGFNVNSEMAKAIFLFFKNGGRRAWIIRASDPAAVNASLVIADRAGVPAAILTARAKYASAGDATDVKITISAGTQANTVKLTVDSAKLNRREIFDNFKITFSADEQSALNTGNSPFYDVNRVNNESKLVTLAKDGTNVHAAPDNLPSLQVAQPLIGGADNIANITGIESRLALFNENYGAGQVAVPGFTTSGVRAALIAHAENFKRIALIDLAADDDSSAALGLRTTLDSSYAALYYPARVLMLDIEGSGLTKLYSPVGAVAGIFAVAEQEIGIHKAPANYRLLEVLDVSEPNMTDGLRETLNDHQINAITRFPEQGIKIYGARVLKSYGRVTAIHEQRVLNAIFYRLKRSLQDFVFQPANGSLFRGIQSVCSQYMRELYRAGALYSPTGNEDAAYRVICDESNNPPEQLQQNKVSVDVFVHIVGMAEMILLQINSVPLAVDFNSLSLGGNQ